MEVSALKYPGGVGLHGRASLLRLQSDERLVSLIRRGSNAAFETLVSRYEARLLAFCRHLLGSREDAEDVLQEALAAAFNAILADDRPINVRPWLYRIARNRSLNHLRRFQAVGVDSMDIHLSDHGASTADKVHDREEFRLLVGDIRDLPETQRTALVLREMDALSYEQIAEAMETTVSGVKSLLVRARVSLAEAAQARLLSCDEVRIELGEVAEGLRRRPSTLVRRHLRACHRCESFRGQLKETNNALTALLPVGPLTLLRRFALSHLGHSASAGSGATAAGSGVTAVGSAAIGGAAASSMSGFISAGIGAMASKAAAGLAVTALVTAGAVEASHRPTRRLHSPVVASLGGAIPKRSKSAHSPRTRMAQPAPDGRDEHARGAPPPALEAKAPATKAATTKKAATHRKAAPHKKRADATRDAAAARASARKRSAATGSTKSTLLSTNKPAAGRDSKALAHKRDQLHGETESQTAPTALNPTSTTVALTTSAAASSPTTSEPPTTSAAASPTTSAPSTTSAAASPTTSEPSTTSAAPSSPTASEPSTTSATAANTAATPSMTTLPAASRSTATIATAPTQTAEYLQKASNTRATTPARRRARKRAAHRPAYTSISRA